MTCSVLLGLLFACTSFARDDQGALLKRLGQTLARQEAVNVGPTTIAIVERSPSAKGVPDIRRTLHYECKRHQGLLAVISEQSEDRYAYNRAYGFRVNRKRGDTAWQLAKICSAGEMRSQILANLNVAAPVSLDFITATRVLGDASFNVEDIRAGDESDTTIVFKCDIKEREDYILKGGEFTVEETGNIVAYRTDVVFADRDAVITGRINRAGGAVASVVISTNVDGRILYERQITNSDYSGAAEFALGESPFLLSTYGFPEPPVERSRWIPYLVFGVLVVLGAAIVFRVKTTAARRKM